MFYNNLITVLSRVHNMSTYIIINSWYYSIQYVNIQYYYTIEQVDIYYTITINQPFLNDFITATFEFSNFTSFSNM